MRRTGPLLVLGASAVLAAGDTARPRGVGPDFARFYKDTTTFTCISNPSISIPYSQVNDDYCDCPDGSDEPGTSACSYLSPLSPSLPSDVTNLDSINATIALPGFYCKNKGHVPSYVPFTNVNDGVCDYDLCCDGSEEYGKVKGVKCEDRCATIGKEAREKAEQRQKSLNAAAKARKDLVTDAARLRKEVVDARDGMQALIEGAEIKVSNLEKELAEIERRERGKVVKGSVGAKAGKLGILVGLAQQRTRELRDHLLRVKEERDATMERLQEVESILSTFKEEYNPNFNDEGVKRAVRAWEDYAAKDKGPATDGAHERDLTAITQSDEENGLNWEEYSTDDEESTELDLLYDFEAYLPAPLRDWLDAQLRSLRQTMIENGILADVASDSSTGETRAVTDARARLKLAQTEVKDTHNSLSKHQEDLEKDYGPDDVFRALKGQCISTDSGEYTYELCFLEKTTQKPKKGGGHTNMGSFVRFDTVTVDEELNADGKGLGSGERLAMRHENGQHCWNGPHRSTTVVMACAEKNEIWKIFEEEKCVYRMDIGSPAVCEGPKGKLSREESNLKDEL